MLFLLHVLANYNHLNKLSISFKQSWNVRTNREQRPFKNAEHKKQQHCFPAVEKKLPSVYFWWVQHFNRLWRNRTTCVSGADKKIGHIFLSSQYVHGAEAKIAGKKVLAHILVQLVLLRALLVLFTVELVLLGVKWVLLLTNWHLLWAKWVLFEEKLVLLRSLWHWYLI